MPFVSIETNLSEDQLSEDFGPSLSKFAAETLNNQKRISISLVTNRRMWRGGSDAPVMQVAIAAVGVLSDAENNKNHSRKFTDFLMEKTGIPIDRILLKFEPIEPWQVGMNGTTA